VPFFWLIDHVMNAWVCTVTAVLAVFFVCDWRSFQRMPPRMQRLAEQEAETWRFEGLINFLLLLVIISAVFLPPGYFRREGAMVGAALASWFLTPKQVRAENAFTFAPIKEVAFLFLGIFATMMPALGYL